VRNKEKGQHCFYRIILTIILLTSTKWWAYTNASKWRMGFNSAFKGLTIILLTSTKWWPPARLPNGVLDLIRRLMG
jgi:hypothetical protein